MRSADFESGRRNAVKACVTWLYARAREMNNPSARAAMTTAAALMGGAPLGVNPTGNTPGQRRASTSPTEKKSQHEFMAFRSKYIPTRGVYYIHLRFLYLRA